MGGSSSKQKLSKEDLDFLMENTNFTKKQIKAWYSGFMVTVFLLTYLLYFSGGDRIATDALLIEDQASSFIVQPVVKPGCTTGLTTGCIYTIQPVVKPV